MGSFSQDKPTIIVHEIVVTVFGRQDIKQANHEECQYNIQTQFFRQQFFHRECYSSTNTYSLVTWLQIHKTFLKSKFSRTYRSFMKYNTEVHKTVSTKLKLLIRRWGDDRFYYLLSTVWLWELNINVDEKEY